MGQRNMLCTSQMLDLEMDQQGQGHLRPEPCVLLGNIADFPHPNVHPVLSASGNTSNLDLRNFPEHHDRGLFYGSQYNGLQHHHPVANIDLGGAAPSNFYNPYMIPSSGSRMFPVPLNHGSSDQLPSSSNPSIIGVGVDEYERNNHFMDSVRSSGKRKNAEGVPGNYQHVSGSASSSSSSLGTPLNTGPHQWEEHFEARAGVFEAAAFVPPEYRANGILSITEGGFGRSVRSRSSTIGIQLDSTLAHNQNHFAQGSYISQSFQPASSVWVEQFGSNGSDGGPSTWNYAPAIPYLHGRGVNGGSLEIASMGGQGYQDTTNSRNSAILLHASSMHHHLHFQHHLPPPHMQAMGGHNYNYHPQVPIPSYGYPANNALHHGTLNPSRDGMETGPRYPRPFPSNGLRIYRPHPSGVRQTAPEDSNRPHLRILSADEVAILEFPGFYEFGNFIDHHRDMRLDIDDMSYEELLALEERIGNVKTGLSEQTILSHLKTRIHVSSATYFHESASTDRENETCIICQVEYKNQEKIGTLDCGHEYHADCIKQWLLVKNVCPICKMPALTVGEMEEGS